jgi:hypothetical protein
VNGSGDAKTLRSFGVYRRATAPNEMCEELAGQVSLHVLAAWNSLPAKTETGSPLERISKLFVNGSDSSTVHTSDGQSPCEQAPIVSGAAQLVRRLQLESTSIASNARAVLEMQLGGDAASFLSTWAAKQATSHETNERDQLEAIDRIFGATSSEPAQGRKIFLLGQSVSAIVQPLEEKLRSELRLWWLSRIDDPRERLSGARHALRWLTHHIHKVEADLTNFRQSVISKLVEVQDAVAGVGEVAAAIDPQATQTISPQVLTYFGLRLDQSAIAAADHIVRLILADAKAMADELTALGREIDQMEAAMARAASAGSANDHASMSNHVCAGEDLLRRASLEAALPRLAGDVDARLQAEHLQENGGLLKTIMQGGRPRAQLSVKLQELSRKVVHQALSDIQVLEQNAALASGQSRAELRSGLAAATPPLLEYGGTRRVLAILPRDSDVASDPVEFSKTLGVEVTGLRGRDNSLTLCVEAGQLSVQHIALDLVQRRRDRVEFAQRVHCRNDIAWTSLLTGSTTTSVAAWNEPDCRSTDAGQESCKTLVI